MKRTELIQQLEHGGCKITNKRLYILDEIIRVEQIVDVEQFWMKVRLRVDISWAAIYSFLNQLYEHGILSKTSSKGRNVVYHLKCK